MIIGIVGCGGIARAHVNALCLNPLVTGLALYDVSPDNVRQLSEISSLPVTNCQDLEQLAGVSQGFIICTPNHLHVSVAEEVLRYKQLPFVCEKPLSTDLNSARYLQEIAPKGSIVSFNYRYNPVIDMIMRLRNERKLGELHFFSAEFNKNSALTRIRRQLVLPTRANYTGRPLQCDIKSRLLLPSLSFSCSFHLSVRTYIRDGSAGLPPPPP